MSNPALREGAFESEARSAHVRSHMTVGGAAAKSAGLTAVLVGAGGVSWTLTQGGTSADEQLYVMLFGAGAPILGFLVALVTIFVPRFSPVTAPLYAVLEGLFLGAVSRFVNEKYAEIVIEAAALTAGVLGAMAVLYATRWIVVTEKFRTG